MSDEQRTTKSGLPYDPSRIRYGLGDALKADRIAAQFRRIGRIRVTTGSSTHQIQTARLEGNVYCVIERPLILRGPS